MTLGIFGDSFCVEDHKTGWAYDLRFTNNLVNHACSGTSLWYSFEKFLANYQKYNKIIFGYTSAHRIHVLPPELAKWAFMRSGPDGLDIEVPADVEKQLRPVWDSDSLQFSEAFDIYVYQKIFNDVNSICYENNIKLINLLPFEGYPTHPYLIDMSSAKGPCITELAHVSDIGRKSIWHCHLSERNNKELSLLMNELLTNDNNNIIPITNNKKFIDDYGNLQ